MCIELGDETRLGRAETCTLVLPDALVSREHCRILRRNLSWMVEDQGSTHGTLLNRQRVQGTRPLLRNDELQVGASRFLFDSDFDLQNADFSDQSVYFSSSTEDTMKVPPVAVLGTGDGGASPGATDAGFDFAVQLSELFDSSRVSFAEALRHTVARAGKLFHAESTLLLMWDSAAGQLRASVAISEAGEVLADSGVIARTHRERKAMLISDRPDMATHPAPGAPAAPKCRSILCAPMEIDGALIGVLYLQRQELDAYSLVDLRNLRAVARLMAVFVETRQKSEASALRTRFAQQDSQIRGTSKALRQVLDLAQRVAPTRVSVLILGETGTGKELMAREIHRLSPQGAADAPFIPVNCSAIPETLFESLVFGHEKGSFTGATRMQQGLIEQANGGTLFLDEIGELSMAMQPKLLRFLQEKSFVRVGGSRPIRADVRLVCATNRDLLAEVRSGRFREDLFHRISVVPLQLPPLRERRSDIAPLADYYSQYHAREMGRSIAGISAEAIIMLEKHDWPGNIRELSNCIERAVLLCDGKVLLPRHFEFQPSIRPSATPDRTPVPVSSPAPVPATPPPPAAHASLAEVEKDHIRRVMASCGNNQVHAAEILGIHRNTLRKKIEEYGLRGE